MRLALKRLANAAKNFLLFGDLQSASPDFVATPVNLHGEDQRGWTRLKLFAKAVQKFLHEISTTGAGSAQKAVRVVSIGPAGKADTYNFEVEDVHEYFANGVLTHNCRYGIYSAGRIPKKPRNVLIAESVTSNDPTAAHMQWRMAKAQYENQNKSFSYRGKRSGNA